MNDPNVIVDVIRQIELPDGQPAAALPSAARRDALGSSRWLAFSKGKSRARLDPTDPRSSMYAVMADDLFRHKWPAYVEVSPRAAANSAITRLSAPKIVRIRAVEELASGRIEVTLQPSHTDYFLSTTNRDFTVLFNALKRARRSGAYVFVVTSPRTREILFVGPAAPSFQPFGGTGKCPAVPDRLETEEQIIASLAPVSLARAQQLFQQMHAMACDSTGEGFCMPYNYPDDGCHARAHSMCEEMLRTQNVQAAKVWLYGSGKNSLRPRTPNHPKCEVGWKYHVAPVLRVRGSGDDHWRVIDPSLFAAAEGVPTPEEWRNRQRDPDATFVFTEAPLFDQFNPGEIHPCDWDPEFKRVPEAIVQYRQELRHRIIWCGEPPYC